jgi:DNA-binding MurR/RpiR family transcriptional regulator
MTSINTLEQLILESINSLTPAETRVARAILDAYPALATRSSSAIAEASRSSPASVIRFVNKLGFADMREFHESIRDGLTGMYRSPYQTLAPASSEDDLIAAVVTAEAKNIAATLNRQTPESIRALRTLLVEASTIAIIGGRFSHGLAVYLHAHLRLIRSSVVILSTADVADDIAHVGRGSVVVVFDFRRYHPQAEFAARYVKGRRGKVVVITDPHVSPAAHHADHTLVAEVEGPHLVESYASVVALLDMIIGDLVATNGDSMRRRISRVESARSQLDELVHTSGETPLHSRAADTDGKPE